jgi:hypothetical protein
LVAFSIEPLSFLPEIFMGITGMACCSWTWASSATSAFCASSVSALLSARSLSSLRIADRAFNSFPFPSTKPASAPPTTANSRRIGLMIGSNVNDIVLKKFKILTIQRQAIPSGSLLRGERYALQGIMVSGSSPYHQTNIATKKWNISTIQRQYFFIFSHQMLINSGGNLGYGNPCLLHRIPIADGHGLVLL